MVERKRESEIRDRDRERNMDDERSAGSMGGNRRSSPRKSSLPNRSVGSTGQSRSRKKK
jgi:hypothetical protein